MTTIKITDGHMPGEPPATVTVSWSTDPDDSAAPIRLDISDWSRSGGPVDMGASKAREVIAALQEAVDEVERAS